MATVMYDILMVDDEPDQLLIQGELLRAGGFTVGIASDATRALEQLGENRIRAVVLDINLAGEDGLNLMDFITTNYPGLPVVLFTGLDHNHEQVKTMLRRGATCYVSKGQKPEELVYAIKEVLSGGQEKEKPK